MRLLIVMMSLIGAVFMSTSVSAAQCKKPAIGYSDGISKDMLERSSRNQDTIKRAYQSSIGKRYFAPNEGITTYTVANNSEDKDHFVYFFVKESDNGFDKNVTLRGSFAGSGRSYKKHKKDGRKDLVTVTPGGGGKPIKGRYQVHDRYALKSGGKATVKFYSSNARASGYYLHVFGDGCVTVQLSGGSGWN